MAPTSPSATLRPGDQFVKCIPRIGDIRVWSGKAEGAAGRRLALVVATLNLEIRLEEVDNGQVLGTF